MIVTGRVDLVLTILIFTRSRMEVVDYFPPMAHTKAITFVRKSKIEIGTLADILPPFSNFLWCMILITIFTLTLKLSAIWYIGRGLGNNHEIENYTVHSSLFFVLGSFCLQGYNTLPRTWACRVVLITTDFTALILFAAYSATFISFLTVKKTDPPFTTFEDLLYDDSYRLGVIPHSAYEDYFKFSENPLMKKVYTSAVLSDSNLPKDSLEGLNRICSRKKYGFLIAYKTYRALERELRCEIEVVPEAYFTMTSSMLLRKNSHYKRLFSHYFQEMKRTGIVKRAEVNVYPPIMEEIVGDPTPEVEINTVMAFYVLIAIGILFSVAIIFLETSIARVWPSPRLRPQHARLTQETYKSCEIK